MRMLLDKGVPKGVRREDFSPRREIIPLRGRVALANTIQLPRHPLHPDSGCIPEVPGLRDWLVEAQKTAKFPWFAHEFIQLDEICTVYKRKPLPGASM
jgi:hypothetical protein